MKLKKELPKQKLKENCENHDHIPATYICGSCGKSICYYCQRNSTLPYQCPECMPAYWEMKIKKDRMFCLVPILIVTLVMVIGMAWLAFFYDPYAEDPYVDIYVTEEDIIPSLDEDSFDQNGNNKIDMKLKIYVTNWGTKDSGDVFIEVYIMKNGTVREEGTSGKMKIKKETTEIFEVTVNIPLDDYRIQLKIWEGGMVVQDGIKDIRVTRGDVEDLTEFDFYRSYDEDMDTKESAGAFGGEFGDGSMIFIMLIIVAVPLMLIMGFLFYRSRTKMPMMMHQAPPAGSPACPACGMPVVNGAKVCPSCGTKI